MDSLSFIYRYVFEHIFTNIVEVNIIGFSLLFSLQVIDYSLIYFIFDRCFTL